jgi:uncharacterized protein YceH (UPF0502 family)
MHRFEEISDVLAGLQRLMERDPSLVAILPRQPGTKEARYAHLFFGPVESIQMPASAAPVPQIAVITPEQDDRIAKLESTVTELQREVAALRDKIDNLFG